MRLLHHIWKKPIACSNVTADIILAAIAPFALCALTGLCAGHRSCTLIILYWLITITGLLIARQIKELGRRYELTISQEFIIYKEPFKSRLIKTAELLSIHAGSDKNLVLKTLDTTIVIPQAILAGSDELSKIKTMVELFASPICRIDMRTPARETI